MAKPTLAELSAALISVLEGPEALTAFQDSGGVWTIGRGHTKGVTEGMTITREQSAQFFAEDQAPLLALVTDQPLFAGAALVSYGYNVGLGGLKKVLAGTDSITNPVHCTDRKGNVLRGLQSRRALENLMIEASKA